jgi:hypothetical protein
MSSFQFNDAQQARCRKFFVKRQFLLQILDGSNEQQVVLVHFPQRDLSFQQFRIKLDFAL